MRASTKKVGNKKLQSVFVGRLSEELNELIALQAAKVFEEHGVVIPVKSCSLMLAIERAEPVSARDLAQDLGRSHQLISQKLPKLLRLKLIERRQDPEDQRQKLYELTAAGREQLAKFDEIQGAIEQAYDELAREVGDLTGMLSGAIERLKSRPLAERIAERGSPTATRKAGRT